MTVENYEIYEFLTNHKWHHLKDIDDAVIYADGFRKIPDITVPNKEVFTIIEVYEILPHRLFKIFMESRVAIQRKEKR
jgi:hypothetical protein